MTNFADEYNTLYRNNGNYDFTDASFTAKVAQPARPWVGWGTGFVDFDNDTWLDLFVVNGHVYPQMDSLPSGAKYRQPKLLHINLGDGSFCDASQQAGNALTELRAARGAAFGDLDNDGQIDVVIGDLDSSPMILRNEGDASNHWITLELGAKTAIRSRSARKLRLQPEISRKRRKSAAAKAICRKTICAFISVSAKRQRLIQSKFAEFGQNRNAQERSGRQILRGFGRRRTCFF